MIVILFVVAGCFINSISILFGWDVGVGYTFVILFKMKLYSVDNFINSFPSSYGRITDNEPLFDNKLCEWFNKSL